MIQISIKGWIDIYKLATLKDKEFNIVKDLSDKQYQELSLQIKTLNTFLKDYKRLTIVVESYKSFEKLITSYLNDMITYRQLTDEVNSEILKYLASFRSFLDHWETYVNRLFGKESQEFKDFKKATGIEFDKYFSYRFIYELRNYTLHCDMPVSNVRAKLDENDIKSIDISVDREKLLSTFKWPKKVGLESMPESFDLRELMKEALKCLERIQQTSLNLFDIRNIYECAFAIYKLRVDYPGYKDFGIVKFSPDNLRTPKSIETIPVHWAEVLLKMLVESK